MVRSRLQSHHLGWTGGLAKTSPGTGASVQNRPDGLVSRGFKRFQVIQGEGLSWIRLDMLDVCQIFLRQNRFYTFPFCPLFRVCVSWAEQGQTWKALAAVGKCDRFCKLQYLF